MTRDDYSYGNSAELRAHCRMLIERHEIEAMACAIGPAAELGSGGVE